MSIAETADRAATGALRPLVFIVDDEPLVGAVIEVCLEVHEYRTKVFHDPTAALAEFRRSDPKPELLITDYHMPGMTGLELINRCKEDTPKLKIILCSGTVEESFLASLVPRPDTFIGKPFYAETLLGAVQTLLRRA